MRFTYARSPVRTWIESVYIFASAYIIDELVLMKAYAMFRNRCVVISRDQSATISNQCFTLLPMIIKIPTITSCSYLQEDRILHECLPLRRCVPRLPYLTVV